MSTEAKLSFRDLFQHSRIGYVMLVLLAKEVQIPRSVIDEMLAGCPVTPAHAGLVLAILSQHTGQDWTFANVEVPLLSTFADLVAAHHADGHQLSLQAGVPFAIVEQMLQNQPVARKDAIKVLGALTAYAVYPYTFDTVEVKLRDEES